MSHDTIPSTVVDPENPTSQTSIPAPKRHLSTRTKAFLAGAATTVVAAVAVIAIHRKQEDEEAKWTYEPLVPTDDVEILSTSD